MGATTMAEQTGEPGEPFPSVGEELETCAVAGLFHSEI